jgi:site-specific recombinase XerD
MEKIEGKNAKSKSNILEKQVFKYYNLRLKSRSINTKRNHHVLLRDISQILWNKFKLEQLSNLKQKHIQCIVDEWKKRGYKNSTLTTKIGFLRRFCKAIGKRSCIKSNKYYGIKRGSVSFTDKRWTQEGKNDFSIMSKVDGTIHKYGDRIHDMLKLQRHFGMRARESLKFWPIQEIKIDQDGTPLRIELTLGTKNGRYRTIPVVTDEQRSFLKNLLINYKTDAIQPYPASQYKKWQRIYFYVLQKIGITNERSGHGLRQAYANDRLKQLIEEIMNKAQSTDLDLTDEEILLEAYRELTQELGHGRIDILKSYLADYQAPRI